MSGKNPGVGGNWSAEYSSWRNRLRPYFRGQEETEVFVLVWGPGEHHKWYPKRQLIVQDLAAMSTYNSVATSEDLMRAHPELNAMPTHKAEEIQAQEADLVIVLLVDDPTVTAAPSEVVLFGSRHDVQAKMRLLKPERWEHARGLLTEMAANLLPEAQTFEYTPQQLEEFNDIRARCRAWVEAVRATKYRSGRQEHA